LIVRIVPDQAILLGQNVPRLTVQKCDPGIQPQPDKPLTITLYEISSF
jgi:hypothetical protein